jgi:hypothetical protein
LIFEYPPISFNKAQTGNDCCIVVDKLTYSLSVVIHVIYICNFDPHRIGTSPNVKTYPDQLFTQTGSCRSSVFHNPAKSASVYKSNFKLLLGIMTIPLVWVAFK